MQQPFFEPDRTDKTSYVRVVLAHKDWLAENLSSVQLCEVLRQVRRNLESERAHSLASHSHKPEEMLEIVADALSESLQGIEMMLSALEHDDEEKVLNGLTTLARATSALREGEKHLS